MQKRFVVLAGVVGGVLAFAFVLALAAQAGVAQAAPDAQAGQFITVTVKAGDNLGKYTWIYGVSGRSLINANKLADPNLIFPGQVITIPVVKSFTPSVTTPFYYVVVSGDTLTLLAKRFEMDPSIIANANGISNGVVVAGSTLLIPAGPHSHVALPGETLKSIAGLHGTTWEVLAANNPGITNPDLILSGQPIFVPILYNAAPVALHGAAPIPTATHTPVAGPTNTPVPGATATKTATPVASPVPGATATKTATPVASPIPGAQNWIKVTVRSGESFVTYVARYGVTGGRLRTANPQIANPNLIFPGDIVNVPVNVSFTPSRTTPFFYVVAAGDSVNSIAAKFEMAATTLTTANPGASFAAGSTVLIPAGPHLYTVKPGDTLATIAAKYGTTADFLLTGNQLPDPNAIFVGQLIYIPLQLDKVPLPFN